MCVSISISIHTHTYTDIYINIYRKPSLEGHTCSCCSFKFLRAFATLASSSYHPHYVIVFARAPVSGLCLYVSVRVCSLYTHRLYRRTPAHSAPSSSFVPSQSRSPTPPPPIRITMW